MRTIATLAVAVILSGCGTYGEPLLLARIYDAQDPCQVKNNGGKYPSWCGATSGRQTIYTNRGAPVGYVQKSR
jgi:hypothetical protein